MTYLKGLGRSIVGLQDTLWVSAGCPIHGEPMSTFGITPAPANCVVLSLAAPVHFTRTGFDLHLPGLPAALPHVPAHLFLSLFLADCWLGAAPRSDGGSRVKIKWGRALTDLGILRNGSLYGLGQVLQQLHDL